MALLFRNYCLFFLTSQAESFYEALEDSPLTNIFLDKISRYEALYSEELDILARHSSGIVDGFGLKDYEIQSVIG